MHTDRTTRIIRQVAEELNVEPEMVNKVIRHFWREARNEMENGVDQVRVRSLGTLVKRKKRADVKR